jgi:hypothetical protein
LELRLRIAKSLVRFSKFSFLARVIVFVLVNLAKILENSNASRIWVAKKAF